MVIRKRCADGQNRESFDACNLGRALEAEEKRRGPMNSKGLAQLAYEKGMYILTAAQAYQRAIEDSTFKDAAGQGHGLLTYALVEEGLVKGQAATNGQNIYLRDWLDYAVQEVPFRAVRSRRRERARNLLFTGITQELRGQML